MRFVPLILLAALTLLGGSAGWAQEQESTAMKHLLNPDQTLKYSDADRKFATSAAVGSRQATVRAFPFAHAAGLQGDGVFHTKAFASKTFQTSAFSTKPARDASLSAAGQQKTFAVKAVAVREFPQAGKTASTQGYRDSTKPFLVKGKRQDTIDDLLNTKEMTIDQVRQLLNKSE